MPETPSADSPVAAAADLLRALGNRARLGIVLELHAHGQRCVHELADALDLPQPLTSQHLRVLRTAGLIHGQRAGKEIRYSIADDHVAHLVLDAISHTSHTSHITNTITRPASGRTEQP